MSFYYDEEYEDGYSDMSYDSNPFESDEDYEDRMSDMDDLIDYYND